MKLSELYKDKIMGAISGLDRIRFRGTIRWLASQRGIESFLIRQHVLLKDFTQWVKRITAGIRESCDQVAQARGIETIYLNRSGVDKEELARSISQEKGIATGPICNLSVLETCSAPQVKGNRASKHLEIKFLPTKCVHVYHYFDHPDYGFGHIRLQTWAPYNVFICLNGRHWLERQLQKQGIGYRKDRNCFPWIEDIPAAQRLLDQQLTVNWSHLLEDLRRSMCPALEKMLVVRPEYYWSAEASEWASDIMFHSRSELDALYSDLIYHGLKISDSSSVLRYFGRRGIADTGKFQGKAPHEVMTDYRQFYEGVRVKYWVNDNSIKVYNKSGSILRIETTINHTRGFKVYRHPNDDATRPASWQRMRKGVSDLHRRCELSQQCNERYAEALISAQVEEKLKEVVAPACRKIKKRGRVYRGLNPWQEEDHQLLTFLAKGEHVLNGFRNKTLREYLYPRSNYLPKEQQRKYAGRVSRRIKLLRVHGFVRKVPKENRYVLTAKGQKFSQAIMAASSAGIKELIATAA